MRILDVQILRDGGTILFTVADDALEGKYRLRTPLSGVPRPLFRGAVPFHRIETVIQCLEARPSEQG